MKTLAKAIAPVLSFIFLLSGCTSIEEPLPTTPTATTPTATTPTTLLETLTETETETEEEPSRIKLLMVGNSGCYYYVEELHEMAAAAGIDLIVANLYESGCRLDEHWEWYRNKAPDMYRFYVTDKSGRNEIKDNRYDTINEVLTYMDWDVITLQQAFNPTVSSTVEGAIGICGDAKPLLDAMKKDCPDAKFYWHHTWSYQVGYQNSSGTHTVESKEKQTLNYNSIRAASHWVAEENDLDMIPVGDAWQLARNDSRVGDILCARIGYNNDKGDNLHDGDIGGGQYLNACVWFEVLTRKSCIGNTYRPSEAKVGRKYDLSEEMITALQEAAHEAVTAIYGADYYR